MKLWYGSTSNNSLSYCVEENRQCIWRWIHEYFEDCLCNVKDEISFVLGIISLICWGVAESPQIIINFRTKSTHGASLGFLLMWIAGDILNLVGCHFEPATLPTQYYTAMLYTTSTLILILQSLYYDYIYKWFKYLKADASVGPEVEEASDSLSPTFTDLINAIRSSSPPRDYYFMSARSFAEGSSPPISTYLLTTRSRPASSSRAVNSLEDESPVEIPETASRPRPIPRRSVGYGAFLATSLNLPSRARGLMQVYASTKVLKDDGGSHSAYFGQYLGWLMVFLYLGCRLLVNPLKGLNPLMFMFAVIANATYVGSILARSTEQKKINANMPWLLDAAYCAGIETCIIIEYLYHRYFKKEVPNSNTS